MALYLDSSVLVKLLSREEGSERAKAKFVEETTVATSRISLLEVTAALWRKRRQKDLQESIFRKALREVDQIFGQLIQIEWIDEVSQQALLLLRKHPLRTLDAIHLASAVFLKDRLAEAVIFAAADHRLLLTAEQEGFPLFNPV